MLPPGQTKRHCCILCAMKASDRKMLETMIEQMNRSSRASAALDEAMEAHRPNARTLAAIEAAKAGKVTDITLEDL